MFCLPKTAWPPTCFIEETAKLQGKRLEAMSLEEMDKLWEQAKEKNRNL